MEQRVCVFVDGENLRHSIVDAFEDQGLKLAIYPENHTLLDFVWHS